MDILLLNQHPGLTFTVYMSISISVKQTTGWYKWAVTKYENGFRIRRYRFVNSKKVWDSLPNEKYSQVLPQDLPNFVIHLNSLNKVAVVVVVNSNKFTNDRVLESFRKILVNKINSPTHINDLMSVLKNHVIKFFQYESKLEDINDWINYETDFGEYLVSLKYSASHIKRIIQVANRFFKFLSKTNPEVKAVIFEPLSHFKLKVQKNDRRKFISESDYKRIIKAISPAILPHAILSYSFGLRCSEVLGLKTDDVYEDCIELQRQQHDSKITKDLKNRSVRSIPYWFISAEDAFCHINNIKPMHQDTLSRLFVREMKKQGLDFQFHDLRRTFITNALRLHHYRDVQLAAGHSDLKTTMLYAQDDRLLQRKKFIPKLRVIS
jgi:integrase